MDKRKQTAPQYCDIGWRVVFVSRIQQTEGRIETAFTCFVYFLSMSQPSGDAAESWKLRFPSMNILRLWKMLTQFSSPDHVSSQGVTSHKHRAHSFASFYLKTTCFMFSLSKPVQREHTHIHTQKKNYRWCNEIQVGSFKERETRKINVWSAEELIVSETRKGHNHEISCFVP